MVQDLPGFYFDPIKNRYYPSNTRGAPLPPTSPASRSDSSPRNPENEIYRRNHIKTYKLLEDREMHGWVSTKSKRFSFQQQYLISQASRPTVWKYDNTGSIADSSLEHFVACVQTPQGKRMTGMLTMGNIVGSIRLFEVGKFEDVDSVVPRKPVCLTRCRTFDDCTVPEHIRVCAEDAIQLSSSVSCIKSISKKLSSADHQLSYNLRRALVSSLGSGGCGGSVYILDLAKPFDLDFGSLSLQRRLSKVASTNCTIWSADINYDGTRAVIGTSKGAALVHVEGQKLSHICQIKSDVLSLQFDHTGNIVLCGLRNGALISLDIRQRHLSLLENCSSSRSSIDQKFPGRGLGASRHLRTLLKGNASPLGGIFMPSAVCSLSVLHSYGNYFLASSMDGSISLFDSRLLQGGAIQRYEGHVNSHSRLQIGVDPTETFFMAGGEDCYTRIWSIKTGEFLSASRMSSHPVVTMCWPHTENASSVCYESPASSEGDFCGDCSAQRYSWAAWLGSFDGLFHVHGS